MFIIIFKITGYIYLNIEQKGVLLFWLNKCVQDGLLSAGYTDFIMRVYNQIPQVTSDGKRLQVIKALISVFLNLL